MDQVVSFKARGLIRGLLPIIFFITLFNHSYSLEKPVEITFIISSSLNGEYEGCYCDSPLRPGIPKLFTVLEKLKKEYPDALLIEAGDTMNPHFDTNAAAIINKAYNRFGFDVLAIGDNEWLNRSDLWAGSNQKWICSSITGPWKNEMIFQKGSTKITVLSFLDTSLCLVKPEENRVMRTIDINSVLKEKCRVRSEKDFLVLISHANLVNTVKLAQNYPELDLIIAGHMDLYLEKPLQIGKTIIVSAGLNGGHVLTLKAYRSANVWNFSNILGEIRPEIVPNPAFMIR